MIFLKATPFIRHQSIGEFFLLKRIRSNPVSEEAAMEIETITNIKMGHLDWCRTDYYDTSFPEQ